MNGVDGENGKGIAAKVRGTVMEAAAEPLPTEKERQKQRTKDKVQKTDSKRNFEERWRRFVFLDRFIGGNKMIEIFCDGVNGRDGVNGLT